MNQVSLCLSKDLLARFARDELSGEAADEVAAHMEVCERCWHAVQELPGEATLEEDLRHANRLQEQTLVDTNVQLERLRALLPDYQIEGEIGRGGMGVVLKAWHAKLERPVALKVLPALLDVMQPDAAARFRREARLAAKLKHNNIISVYDFGEVAGILYYAMELVEGPSLHEILRNISETGTIDFALGQSDGTPARHTCLGSSSKTDVAYFRQVAEWICQIAEGLAYAHDQGIVHRDIKPSNLLLGADRRLRISDFGLARSVDAQSITKKATLLGTLRYLAPEQLCEDAGSNRPGIDVYALGATMYELLAFRPVFAGVEDRDILNRVLSTEPPPPSRWTRQVPRDLETICLTAIEKDRHRRYASAQALADDIRRWLLGIPIQARRAPLIRRTLRLIRRRKLITSLLGIAIITALFAGLTHARYLIVSQDAEKLQRSADDHRVQLAIMKIRHLLSEHDGARALAIVDEELSRSPDNVTLHLLRGDALSALRRNSEEAVYFEELLQAYPDEWRIHFALAALKKRAAPGEIGDRNRAELEEDADLHRRRFEDLLPSTDVAEVYFLKAIYESDSRKAVEYMDSALALDPRRPCFLEERSRRRLEHGDHDGALLDAERWVLVSGNDPLAYHRRAGALYNLGRYEQALLDLDRAVQLEPGLASLWQARALVLYSAKRFEEAIANADRAIVTDPQYAKAYVLRGAARVALAKYDAALADVNRGIQLDPLMPDGYITRSWLHRMREEYDAAIADGTRAIDLGPDDPRGYSERAEAYMMVNRPSRALSDLIRLVECNPHNEDAHLRIANVHADLGQYDEAIKRCTAAINLNPHRQASFQQRATLHVRAAHFAEAIVDFSRALESRPDEPVLLLWRGVAQEFAGNVDAAIADYQRAASKGGNCALYALLYEYCLGSLNQRASDAARRLASHHKAAKGSSWEDHLFQLFAGKMSPAELLSAAATDDERADAHYYSGVYYLLHEDAASAAAAMRACVALGRRTLESDLARERLRRLGENDPY